MKAENEIWQVMSRGEIYQADLPTLKQWIFEGAVLPEDKVRKGGFNWIEAGHAPMLRTAFTGEWQPPSAASAPAEVSTAAGAAVVEGAAVPPAAGDGAAQPFLMAVPAEPEEAPALDNSCRFHPQQAPQYVCRPCAASFCRGCARRVENSLTIALCPLCGRFLHEFEQVAESVALHEYQRSGFGLRDFGRALAEPLRHAPSLIGGALLYGLLLMAGARGQLLASALMFGCISLVIGRVGYGRLDRDFLPDFGSFSFWDDVLVPGFLGLGVTLVTLAPAALLVAALFFGVFGAGSPSAVPTVDAQALEQAAGKASRQLTPEEMERFVSGAATEEERQEVERKLRELSPTGQVAREVEESKQEQQGAAVGVLRQLLARPGLILLLGLLALGWAVFYHPMALLVAGWTADFKSVINPLVGIDTLRHMGLLTYAKAFAMYLAVQVVIFVAGLLIGLVMSPFDMPFVGNLPATFLNGTLTFYGNLVVAYALGLALFKSADRLCIDIG